MRECLGCSCAAVCLPLGKKEFYARLYMCPVCQGAIYQENVFELPFGRSPRMCRPVCWVWRTEVAHARLKGGTCQSCREKLQERKNESNKIFRYYRSW